MVKSVLFVCLGNTCRSPMAQAIFEKMIKESNREGDFKVDSAAIKNWHVGNHTDSRCRKVLLENNIDFTHAVRQIVKKDFMQCDNILCMDQLNVTLLNGMQPIGAKAKIELLGHYDPEGIHIIEDPYCDREGTSFYKCYEQIDRSCRAFLAKN